LLGVLQLRTPGWFTWFSKNDQYSRQKLQADLESMRSYYLNAGYLEFNIDSTQVSISPDRHDIYITVNITEGEKFEVGDVKLGGDLPRARGGASLVDHDQTGRNVFQGKAHRVDQGDTDRLGRDGYAFANVMRIPISTRKSARSASPF